jgi:hypothetical protein
MIAGWVMTDHLGAYSFEQLLELYILADRMDVPALRATIMDQLVTVCFKSSFKLPKDDLIRSTMENVPKALPIHTLLTVAVARVLYHEPEGLESVPYGFGVRVKSNLDKVYGICDDCYDYNNISDDPGQCEHFFDQPSDFDPQRSRETLNATRW